MGTETRAAGRMIRLGLSSAGAWTFTFTLGLLARDTTTVGAAAR